MHKFVTRRPSAAALHLRSVQFCRADFSAWAERTGDADKAYTVITGSDEGFFCRGDDGAETFFSAWSGETPSEIGDSAALMKYLLDTYADYYEEDEDDE